MCRTNKIVGQETENVSDKMIGCLCWFFESSDGCVIGILKEIQEIGYVKYYLDDNGRFYRDCRPVKPDEVKFYGLSLDDKLTETYMKGLKEGQDTKDTDYKITCLQREKEELKAKVHILNEANMKLENENGRLATKYSQLKEENKELNDTFLKLDKASKDLEKEYREMRNKAFAWDLIKCLAKK